MFFCIWLISKLPDIVIRYLGNILGLVAILFAKKRVRVGLINLSLCFHNMSEKEKRSIIYKHFQALMIGALEYSLLFFGSKNRINNKVIIRNKEFLDKYYQKKPIILLSPHFIGLDLAANKLSIDYVGISLYAKQKNKIIDSKLKESRTRFMNGCGGVYPRDDGFRTIVKRLRCENILFYYLPDQDLGEKDSTYVPFFDHKNCATINILPKLIKLTNAVVVPMSVFRRNDRYIINLHSPWDDYPSGDPIKDVLRLNQFIEEEILKDITQYFWLHKRFKTQPNMVRGALYK